LVKKEIRILGLAITHLRDEPQLVGAIFRGNLWLDGIFTCAIEMHGDYISDIAQAILRSRQYSQTRVLISREVLLPKGIRDLRKLNSKTRLPAISIVTSKTSDFSAGKPRTSQPLDIKIGKRHVEVQTFQLDEEVAREIFLVGCKENSLVPEALRIAELAATALQKLR
jgi:endonuclease V-like protein UPF0215 family